MRIPAMTPWLLILALLPGNLTPEVLPSIPVTPIVLPNGMRILVVPRKGSPMVACRLFYKVGSVDEAPGMTGLAHFFEHMMFKGTSQIGVKKGMLEKDRKLRLEIDALDEGSRGAPEDLRAEAHRKMEALLEEERHTCIIKDEIFSIYRSAGATGINAFTTNEFTCYVVDIPPQSLETYFWVESDRMHNLEPREFHSEREVVRGERRMRYESQPSSMAEMDIMKRVYGGTAYGWPVIGWAEDLDRVSCREAMDFYREHYAPGNAVMVLVGDLDPEHVRKLADTYFAPSTRSSKGVPRRVRNIQPPLGRCLLEYPIPDDDTVIVTYPLPGSSEPQSVAADLLIAYLNGRQGVLHSTLVQERKLARSCTASRDGFRDADHLTITCVLRSSIRHEEAQAEIEKLLSDVVSKPMDSSRLLDVKRRKMMDQFRSLRSDAGLALSLGHYELFGSWQDLLRDSQRLQDCPLVDVQALARQVVNPAVACAAYIRDTRVARGGS